MAEAEDAGMSRTATSKSQVPDVSPDTKIKCLYEPKTAANNLQVYECPSIIQDFKSTLSMNNQKGGNQPRCQYQYPCVYTLNVESYILCYVFHTCVVVSHIAYAALH